MRVIDICCKIFITFIKYLIIIPLALCAIPFVILVYGSGRQIGKAIAGKI